MATTTKTTKGKQPTHGVYHVSGEGESARWTKIGAAWPHQDTKGFSLALDYLPLNPSSRMVIRAFTKDEER